MEIAVSESDVVRDLVVSYCFPPYADTAAIVAAKRVEQRGRPVHVLQNAMTRIRKTDDGLMSLTADLVRRRYEVPSPTAFSSWRSIREFTFEGLQTALKWDREGPGYIRLYSRAQFAASHFLAARIVISRPSIEWTAEFSDPLSHDVTGAVRHASAHDDSLLVTLGNAVRDAGFEPPTSGNAMEWAEVLPFALADEILFTNAHQRDFMLSAIDDPRLRARVEERGVITPHPTPPPDFYHLAEPEYDLDAERINIAYFGNFYVSRGIGDVLEGLKVLPAELRSRICLHVFTSAPAKVEETICTLGLEDCVRTSAFVPFLDFLQLTTRMDALVVNDADTAATLGQNPFLPSKWSDYRGSGTPVWGLVEAGSTLDGLPLAFRSPIGHVTATVQVLAQMARSLN